MRVVVVVVTGVGAGEYVEALVLEEVRLVDLWLDGLELSLL